MTQVKNVRWAVVEGVIAQRMGDEAVLFDVDRNVYYGLNAVGVRVWELIKDRMSRVEIVEALLGEHHAFRVDVERDVDTLAAELESNGLILRCSAASPRSNQP